MRDPIVILGCGPAGLACAYKILSEASNKKVVLIDKAPYVGGAGASFQWKGHTLDFGPHAFHRRGDEPERLVRDLFKDNPELLIEGRKQVHVLLRGKRFRYPLQISEALLKFNPLISLKIIVEFLLTSLFHAIVSIPIENFEDWGRKRFGGTLYRLTFGDYTEKVWKTKATRISPKFAAEKIQGFNFVNLIKRLLKIGGQVTEPYYQQWLYHRYGSGKLYEKLGQRIRDMGGELLLSTNIKSIEATNGSTGAIVLVKDGAETHLPYSVLVNTLPLPQVISLMGRDVPFVVRHAASKLTYVSLIIVYLEFDMERGSNSHWFYLLDKKFRFNRVTEQKNLSPYTTEQGKTVLSFELTCRMEDDEWNRSDAELFELAKEDCKGIPFLPLNKISDYLVKRVPHVYEVYNHGFDHFADIVLSYFRELDNVVSIGRRGLFLQGDMHQAVDMGIHMGEILKADHPDPITVDQFYRKYVRYLNGQ